MANLLPTSPEQLARALLPGLQAITRQQLKASIMEAMADHIEEWVNKSFPTTIKTTITPEGKLAFLIEIEA